jgi:hypothetical protein
VLASCSNAPNLYFTHEVGCTDKFSVRFQVLTVTGMEMTVFWDVAPHNLVDTDSHFRGAYCLCYQGDCEISVKIYQTTLCNI